MGGCKAAGLAARMDAVRARPFPQSADHPDTRTYGGQGRPFTWSLSEIYQVSCIPMVRVKR